MIPNKANAIFISVLKIAFKENGSWLARIFSKPLPASVKTKTPGKIPTNVVHAKVTKETPKKAGAILTSQKGNKGTNLKKSKVKMNRVILFCRYFLIRMVKLMLINLDQRLRI